MRLPMWVAHPTDPDGDPYRPIGAVWVSLRTGLIHVDVSPEGSVASSEFALAALVEFGLRWAKGLEGRPARVEVRDESLRDALAASLAGLSTSVIVVDDLPAVREVLTRLEEDSSDRERIWDHLTNEDLILVETPAPKAMRRLCILGNGGEQFGLAFFDSRPLAESAQDAIAHVNDLALRPDTEAAPHMP